MLKATMSIEISMLKLFRKKVKLAQEEQYNYILVVGSKEVAERKVNVRTRDGIVHGMQTIDEVLSEFAKLSNWLTR